ncbi:MAG: nucleotidyl transferase AbiEii/AbiGii toxin family protein [Vicinamibacterales bacterium]
MSGSDAAARAESIRHRLRNELRARGEDLQHGLPRYAVERFLYRLGRSRHREAFVLKGATLFAMWGTTYRPTRDIDFTGYGSPEPDDVVAAFREICDTPDDVDALVFDPDAITAEPIRDGSEYAGHRIRLKASLGGSDITVQVDVGFGNAIVPGPEEREFRTMLGDPPPRILAYPPESVIAEKLHAMASLGERNSRYKDFYDVYAMADAFRFERATLAQAVRATFERRRTLPSAALPVALTAPFFADPARASQWRAYVNRNGLTDAPDDLMQVGERISAFLQPVWIALVDQDDLQGEWKDGGPWR